MGLARRVEDVDIKHVRYRKRRHNKSPKTTPLINHLC